MVSALNLGGLVKTRVRLLKYIICSFFIMELTPGLTRKDTIGSYKNKMQYRTQLFSFSQLQSIVKYAKDQDNSLSLVILNCIMGRLVAVVTESNSMELYEIVLEMMLPQLLRITQLEGSYEPPEVGLHCSLRATDS